MPIERVETNNSGSESVTAAASNKLNEVLKNAVESQTPVLLLLSGGSSLALLDKVSEESIGPNVTITVLDERYSQNSKENNFAQIAASPFYSRAVNTGAKFIDTHVNGRMQENLAQDFNDGLIEWLKNNPDGTVTATVGIGPDGHTSGMMPYPEDPEEFKRLFDDGDDQHLVTSYDATGKNPYAARVTTNMNLLRKIDTAIIYVVGENKRAALESLSAAQGSLAATPARILNEIKGTAFLFTDIN
jgi:6-phosphogluconolactonase/glucosamine-6-phosphate isomerase/deaminase